MKFDGDTPQLYSDLIQGDISYIFMRDIPDLVQEYAHCRGKALDYGCGTGLRMPFLKELGFEVEGVDIEPDMLALSQKDFPEFPVTQIESANIPCADNTYDLVFICYVLLIVPSLEEVAKIMREVHRVLKPGGIVIIATSSDYVYDPPYNRLFLKSVEQLDVPLETGGRVEVKFSDIDLTVQDYYWSDEDYRQAFSSAGLHFEKCHHPLGRDDEGLEWKDEKDLPFSSIYILRKP